MSFCDTYSSSQSGPRLGTSQTNCLTQHTHTHKHTLNPLSLPPPTGLHYPSSAHESPSLHQHTSFLCLTFCHFTVAIHLLSPLPALSGGLGPLLRTDVQGLFDSPHLMQMSTFSSVRFDIPSHKAMLAERHYFS